MKTIAIIPARFSSTRLPGKPLKDICGKPMVWWVYQQVMKVKGFEEIVVATDNSQIYDVCKKYKMNVIMTNEYHTTAIHRLEEVSKQIKGDYYIQVNGDEPLITPEMIAAMFLSEKNLDGISGKNIITKMTNPVEVMDVSNIKMVFNEKYECTYMSRSPIPFPFKQLNYSYYKHVGVIGYTLEMLQFFVNSVPGRLERIEGIDLLRFIDYNKKLCLHEVEECHTLSVDTEKDLEEVRKRMLFHIE